MSEDFQENGARVFNIMQSRFRQICSMFNGRHFSTLLQYRFHDPYSVVMFFNCHNP